MRVTDKERAASSTKRQMEQDAANLVQLRADIQESLQEHPFGASFTIALRLGPGRDVSYSLSIQTLLKLLQSSDLADRSGEDDDE